MNFVDWLRTSADERELSGRRAVVICMMGCLRGFIVLHWPFVSPEQSLWSFSGLDSCVLAYCGSVAPLERYWCCRTWVEWSAFFGGAKCGLIVSNEKEVQSFLGLQRLLARSLPRRLSRRACMCLCIHFVCVCVYMCMCVYMRTCIFEYICMCVCICTSMRFSTCVCIFVHRSWVLVSVAQRVDGVMHMHVFSCAYVCVYICMWVYIHVHFLAVSVTCTLQVFWALVHGQVCMLHGCVFTPTYTLPEGYVHMCICIYVCICMRMHMDAYVRLWYCLTRWGVVTKIFYLCIRVHMHAYVYVCACMCV